MPVSTSVCHPFHRTRRKVSPSKRKSISSDLRILYSVPEVPNPNLSLKLRCARNPPVKTLELFPFWRQLGSSLGLDIPVDSFEGFLFVLPIEVYSPSSLLGNYILLFIKQLNWYISSIWYKIDFWLICLTLTWNALLKKHQQIVFIKNLEVSRNLTSNTVYHTRVGYLRD